MKSSIQKYLYKEAASIIGTAPDEYVLSEEEYYKLHSFYLTYSMCGTQSAKKRSYVDYGWPTNTIRMTRLGTTLERVLDLSLPNFVFTNKNDLGLHFSVLDLSDGPLIDVDYERGVIGITNEQNKYMKLFYRIRNGFAHGRFRLRY